MTSPKEAVAIDDVADGDAKTARIIGTLGTGSLTFEPREAVHRCALSVSEGLHRGKRLHIARRQGQGGPVANAARQEEERAQQTANRASHHQYFG